MANVMLLLLIWVHATLYPPNSNDSFIEYPINDAPSMETVKWDQFGFSCSIDAFPTGPAPSFGFLQTLVKIRFGFWFGYGAEFNQDFPTMPSSFSTSAFLRSGLKAVEKRNKCRLRKFLMLLLLLLGGDIETNPGPGSDTAASQPSGSSTRAAKAARSSLGSVWKDAECGAADACTARVKLKIGEHDYQVQCRICKLTYHGSCFGIPEPVFRNIKIRVLIPTIQLPDVCLSLCCDSCIKRAREYVSAPESYSSAAGDVPDVAEVAVQTVTLSGNRPSHIDAAAQTTADDSAASADEVEIIESTHPAAGTSTRTDKSDTAPIDLEKSAPKKIVTFEGFENPLSNFFSFGNMLFNAIRPLPLSMFTRL
jgi:hypothetical protein